MSASHLQARPVAASKLRLLRRLRSTKAQMPASDLDCSASADPLPRHRSSAQQQAIDNSNTHNRELRTALPLAYRASHNTKSVDTTTKERRLGRDTESFCNHSEHRLHPMPQLPSWTHRSVARSQAYCLSHHPNHGWRYIHSCCFPPGVSRADLNVDDNFMFSAQDLEIQAPVQDVCLRCCKSIAVGRRCNKPGYTRCIPCERNGKGGCEVVSVSLLSLSRLQAGSIKDSADSPSKSLITWPVAPTVCRLYHREGTPTKTEYSILCSTQKS